MLVGRRDCHRLAHFNADFNVAKKPLGQFETKPTDSEDLNAILHPVISSTRLFQTPTTTASGADNKTGSRGEIIDTIINIIMSSSILREIHCSFFVLFVCWWLPNRILNWKSSLIWEH